MPQRKTHNEIINECMDALGKGISCFYRSPCVMHRGTTSDTGIPYTECTAEWLLNEGRLSLFSNLLLHRENSYNQNHLAKGITFSRNPRAQNNEKTIAKRLFLAGKTISDIRLEDAGDKIVLTGSSSSVGMLFEFGHIIDFEVPLNAYQNSNSGDIDLLAVDDKKETVYILELKKPKSTETLLRCVLEGHTYLSTVDKEMLYSNYNIPKAYKLRTAPLIFTDCKAFKEFREINNRPKLKELMDKLDIKPFILDIKDSIVQSLVSKNPFM